jgi:hypothetical protein
MIYAAERSAANNRKDQISADPHNLVFLPSFPPLLFHDPEYPVPHRAGAAFLGKDEVEDLVHAAVAHTQ